MRIWYQNFGYYSQEEPKTLAATKEQCVKAGFQASVVLDGEVVATWCPIGGWRPQRR